MSKIAFKGDDGALKILSEEIENEGFNIISANHFLEKSFSSLETFIDIIPLYKIS